MKRTFQPKKKKRLKKHGFRSKMKTKGGKKLLKRKNYQTNMLQFFLVV